LLYAPYTGDKPYVVLHAQIKLWYIFVMTITIAIIEDNPEFLATFKNIIANHSDLTILAVASDCASGYAMLQGKAADVLLVDLGLPDGSGLDVIYAACQLWPNTEVMVISVFGNQKNVIAALAAGATGYLLKDSDDSNLAEQIRILKAGGSPISPVIARQLLMHLNPASIDKLEELTPLPQVPFGNTQMVDGELLSKQEKAVLTLASKGYNFEEVAERLGITRHTVATYVKRCYRKLQVNSKSEAIYEARKHGFVED
jgi:DNA-binding NarL/FixJ family response regulator